MSDNKTPKNLSSQFLQEAYALDSQDDLQTFYRNWADAYDAQLENELAYVAPAKTAELFKQYVSDRRGRVLDLGCGTGLTSVGLADSGYTTIDGLDFSSAMLGKARARGFYDKLIEADLNKPLAIADNEYDSALSSGTFTHGHVGAEPLDEIVRIIKPGGYFVCTIHADIWQPQGFERKIEALNESRAMRTVELTRDIYFEDSTADGMFYVFQKC